MAKKQNRLTKVGSIGASIPIIFATDSYDIDDTPKRFKRLMQPDRPRQVLKVDSSDTVTNPIKNPEIEVKPGESFRKFNERLNLNSKGEIGTGEKSSRKNISQEFSEARGLRAKRKEHLNKRREKYREKKSKGDLSDDDDLVNMEFVRFGERVEAPPVLKVRPKNAPKSTLRFKRK